MKCVFFLWAIFSVAYHGCFSFAFLGSSRRNIAMGRSHVLDMSSTSSSIPSDVEKVQQEDVATTDDVDTVDRLKRELLALAACYDRGFGASSSAAKKVDNVISKLEAYNPTQNAAKGITGNETSPLEGSWCMIWCTALDVLVLEASPVASVGAIYQVFSPPVITNVIDFIPRAQSLFPSSFLGSTLVRAQVKTRGSSRKNLPNRVGLRFEAVNVAPVEILGQKVGDNLPPLKIDLPNIDGLLFGSGEEDSSSPGYFDVTYLDDELLVIRQNAPGGMFALKKTPDFEP